MIDFIRGIVAEKELTMASLEANGVGYELLITLSTYEKLPPVGEEAKLFTHFHVREDTQKLYGFLTRAEREIFRQLIGVSSIGPKTAIGILSKISPEDLVKCLALGDPSRLTKIPGVGAKTAERLILELRGKLTTGSFETGEAAGDMPGGRPRAAARDAGREAGEALLALGYNEKQVTRAIERVRQVAGDKEMPVEEWIRKALQVI
ncbi:MAG: Holliday junction branch migration protein RuvA [Chitinispirillaceae bacterium]|jgi:Holliday junction DNA helicase RuvA